jgi:hypothetical protein
VPATRERRRNHSSAAPRQQLANFCTVSATVRRITGHFVTSYSRLMERRRDFRRPRVKYLVRAFARGAGLTARGRRGFTARSRRLSACNLHDNGAAAGSPVGSAVPRIDVSFDGSTASAARPTRLAERQYQEIKRYENQSCHLLRGRQAARNRHGGSRRSESRRGIDRAQGDRYLSHGRVHPLRRRSGGPLPRHLRA